MNNEENKIENKIENNATDIKKKALSSFIWKFLERIAAQAVSLIVSIIIARILNPEDYSVVSLVTIFFTFANVFISGGLNTALIQKKDADKDDYFNVLIVSLIISALIYVILFFCAPLISSAFKQPILVWIVRIMGLILPIDAIKAIYCAYISAALEFRKFFLSTIVGTAVSAAVGIVMALNGCGAWALVAQQMSNTVIDTLILIIVTRIKFGHKISFQKLKVLIKYSWKVFGASLINTAYSQATPLIIGAKYSSNDLSYYTKGRSFPDLISSTTTNTLSAVMFPFMAKYQDDKEQLLRYTRLYMQLTSFLVFPLMLGFFAVANNFVEVILTEKWLPAVPYIRIFCICSMIDMIAIGECETIKAMGRSGVFLIMEVIKKTLYLGIIIVFLFLSPSPEILTYSMLACSGVSIIVNSIPNIKLIGYKLHHQIFDVLFNFLLSVAMCATVFFMEYIPIPRIACLILQIFSGIVIYVALCWLTRNNSFRYIIQMLKNYLKSHKKTDSGKEMTRFGKFCRGIFRKLTWGICRFLPINKKKIVVASFLGNGYSDNPKYIIDELLKLNEKYKIIWLVKGDVEASSLPDKVVACKIFSCKSIYHLSTASVWIDNARKGRVFKKKKQLYMQTWHGCGVIKKVEKDVEEHLTTQYIKNAIRDAKITDIMISDCDFTSERYREAYWFRGRILQSGFPRDDIFYGHDQSYKQNVYSTIKIPVNKKIVLYVPTFRNVNSIETYRLDILAVLKACSDRFGGDFVLIIRLHPNIKDEPIQQMIDSETVFDGTNYPDIQELLAASEIVISDYSSALIDFGFTLKPSFRFALDVEEYSKDRNFYFDFDSYPFPLAQSNAELIRLILSFNQNQYENDIKEFFKKIGITYNYNSSKDCALVIKEFIACGCNKKYFYSLDNPYWVK